jgi:hypothetical protein
MRWVGVLLRTVLLFSLIGFLLFVMAAMLSITWVFYPWSLIVMWLPIWWGWRELCTAVEWTAWYFGRLNENGPTQ